MKRNVNGLADFEQRVFRPFLVSACLYEACAITTGRFPTITRLFQRLYNDVPGGRAVLWTGWGWLTVHLFERVVEQTIEAVGEAVEIAVGD